MSESANAVARTETGPGPVRLYEMTDAYVDILEELMETDGVLTPELEERLDQIQGKRLDKIERTLKAVRQMEADAAVRDAMLKQYTDEVARLRKLRDAGLNSAKALKGYVQREMERAGEERLETPTFKVRIQRASRPAIRWMRDLKKLPTKYRKVTVEPDTTQAWEDLRAGGKLPAGFAVEYSRSLRIQ